MEFSAPPPPPPSPAVEPPAALPPRRRRLPHAAMAGGLAFGMALGGAGIAFAAGSGSGSGNGTGSTTTPNSQTTPNGAAPKMPPAMGKHAGRFAGPLAGLGIGGGRLLYGQATIQTPSGATKTVDFQVGTVTAKNISGESGTITVASGTNNAHTQVYAVQSSTIVDAQAGGIGTVNKGDTVVVIAEENGSGNPTAMDIRDQTQMKNSRQGFGFGGQSPKNGPANPPAGTTSGFNEIQ